MLIKNWNAQNPLKAAAAVNSNSTSSSNSGSINSTTTPNNSQESTPNAIGNPVTSNVESEESYAKFISTATEFPASDKPFIGTTQESKQKKKLKI